MKRLWPNLGRDLLLNGLLATPLLPRPLRWRLMRVFGMEVENSRLSPRCWIGSRKLAIGEGTFVNYHVRFNTAGGITIGRRCDIGMGVSFVTQSHELGSHERRAGRAITAPIVVGDGVWIGAHAVILPGVTIADGAIIAAGSLVTKDCEPDALYLGSPAAKVQDLA